MTVQVNQLGNLVQHIKADSSFYYYEDTLKMLESLLVALNKIPPLSDKGELVRSMEPMILNLENRIKKCREKFLSEFAHRKDLQKLCAAVENSKAPVTGCYFCSRPFSLKSFKKIAIKFQGKKMHVFACPSCRAELRSRRSVDILHFIHNNRSVHWSELPGYNPATDYWTLNSRRTQRTRPRLELITNNQGNE